MIRVLKPSDWPAVKAIYIAGIRTGQATFETVENVTTFEAWYASKIAESVIVYTKEERILGWGTLSLVSSRAVYAGVAEGSVYVDVEAQGLGVGTKLLEALITYSENNDIWTLQASIFPENKASIALHEKNGFRVVGYREKIAKQYGVWRNTFFMERRSSLL